MKFTDWWKSYPNVEFQDEAFYCVRAAWFSSKENERQRWVAKIEDEMLADRVSKDCHDPGHDDRWCSTCEAREAGIEEYRKTLLEEWP